MIKDILFKMATPLACAISVALTPMGMSANQYYYNNYCEADNCCCDPCQQDPCCQQPCCDKKRGWMKTAAIVLGAAAVGAVAAVAASSNKKRHHHISAPNTTVATTTGPVGPQGPRGPSGPVGPVGPVGPAGAPGFVEIIGSGNMGTEVAVVPAGQTNAGEPITSLTFTFTTIGVVNPGPVVPFVTTQDGRNITGTPLSGDMGSTTSVTITNGSFSYTPFHVGVIVGPANISRAGVVSVEITELNGTGTAPTFGPIGVSIPAGILTTETIFPVAFPFPGVS